MANIIAFDGRTPNIHKVSFVASSADIIGDVRLGEGASVWFHTTIRGDVNHITIGKCTNIQDNSVLHAESSRPDMPDVGPTRIGDYVTVGHGVIIHACTIEDCCLIGMGAVILDGAVVGKGSIVGAGAVVTPGTVIPPFSMVLGMPGKVVKELPQESISDRIAHAERYSARGLQYARDNQA